MTVTSPTVLTNNGTLTVGTALAGTGNLTQAATGILNLNFTGALGITTLSASAVGNLVSYGFAGTQTVKGTTYNNLTLTGSGAKTTTGATVNGVLSMEGTATTTGTVATYGASATIQYKGSAAQTTGTEFPTTFASASGVVLINNAAGVTLNASKTISTGQLNLVNGILNASTFTLKTATVLRTNGWVNGKLSLPVTTGSPTVTYLIGDASSYIPVSLVFANVTVAGYVVLNTTAGQHPNISTSGINYSLDISRYYTISNAATTFTSYSPTFNFVAGDIIGGANPSNFVVKRYSAGWTTPTLGSALATSTSASAVLYASAFGDFAIGVAQTFDH